MRRILIITTIFLFISATPAHAVIPQFMPIIQMLLSLLPQIALFVLFSISLIFKFSTWRRIFSKATSNPLILAITVIAVVSVGFYFFLFRNTPRMTVSDNISQYAWINFGGNASRTGNVDGKPGPEYGEEIWKFREAIDRAPFISSAAVVDYLSAEESRTLMDIIPYDTIAYLSISNLDAVSQTVVNSPEWKELYSMDEVKEGLAQPEQLMTMLLGLTPEELVKILGHKLVFSFLGIENNLPVACLAIDAGENKGQAQYAIEQLISFTALSGQMTPREDSYREVPYTGISLGEIEIAYGFLDNFVLAGSNGGFEKMVDLYKDGGKNIEDNPNFQFIGKKVNLSSEICLFANVERVIPILPELQKLMDKKAELSEKSEEDEEFQKFLENTVLPSIKGFGISLSLSGIAHKVYLHIEPNTADNPLFNLLLTAHPTMSSIKFLPVDGALVGVQIGDAVTLFDSLLNVAEFFGQNREDIEKKISEAEQTVGLNLRNDLLSALTGEIGVMALLPNGEVNLKKNKLDFAKFRPILLLGINDRYKLEKTASKITQLAQLRTKKLDEEEYRDFKIYTNLLPLNMLIPGAALMPAYTYKDDLLIISNSAIWVKDAVDMLAESRLASLNPEIEKELESSWVLAFANAGEILNFVTQQNLIDNLKLPENAIDKLGDFGSLTVSYSAEPDGIGISILSQNPWITEILRAVMLGVYADQAKKEQVQKQPKE